MGETISNNLENYDNGLESQKEIELAELINDTKLNENEHANDVIKGLDASKLSSYIEKSFKENDNWLTYGEMKRKNKDFYNFTVEAAIDLLSDKLVSLDGDNKIEKKFDLDGNESENGKTLDEYLKSNGGIDNSYSKDLVKLVQKILKLKPADGLAGPQFFAKICSILKGEPITEFKVKGYDNDKNKYKYNLDDDIREYNIKFKEHSNLVDNFISNNNLIVNNNNINKSYFGIPDNVKIYIKNDPNSKLKGYYYFDGNDVVYIPNFVHGSKDHVCLQKTQLDNTKNWKSIYPNESQVFYKKLKDSLDSAMNSLGILGGYELYFYDDNKYHLKSYGNDIVIDLSTIIKGWMYGSVDLINDFKLINLVNYLKSKGYSGTFSFNRDGTILQLNGKILYDVGKFNGTFYKKLDASHQKLFINYLNTNLVNNS